MSEESLPQWPTPATRQQVAGRLWRLALKELRETLRDRRTIITLVVMPLLIYPLLALVFQRFLFTSIAVTEDVEYVVGVESDGVAAILNHQIGEGNEELQRRETADPEKVKSAATDKGLRQVEPRITWVEISADEVDQHMADSSLHLAVLRKRDSDDKSDEGLTSPRTWELVYRIGSPTSEGALQFVESRLRAFSELNLDRELEKLGVTVDMPADTTRRAIDFAGAPAFSLAALIPLILVLMTITGAVYPAIDLTAGERERGTLETLIAAPVPRVGLLLAKYVAVLTVALMTALINLIGMSITARSTGLATMLFGSGSMSAGVVLKVLVLLGLFAAFFSAILLALTSYARSFKEAQAYIIPLMLVSLVPGVICLLPGLQFTGWLAVTPLVNIVLLSRDVLEGSVDTPLAIAAVCSTALYIAAAIALAARIFGTDAILYGSQSTWSEIFERPTEIQPAATMSAAMFCLAIMFPTCFLLAGNLSQMREFTMSERLVGNALITILAFGGIPILLAMFGRVRWSSGFGMRSASICKILACVVLGLSLWPVAHELYLMGKWLGIASLSRERIDLAQSILEQWKGLSPALILVVMAVVPGVFEEFCFRGYLFGALRNVLSATQTIVISALLFGIFHEVLAPGRLLPSTFMGLVLGWVRSRTGSVLPCMLLHVLHDGLLISVILWQEQLTAIGIGADEAEHLPTTWLAMAAVAIAAGVAMLVASTRENRGELNLTRKMV